MSNTAVQFIDDVEYPAAGTWEIDPGHTEVAFIGRHFGLTKIRGRFPGVAGRLVMADDPADAHLQVEIDMASVESGDRSRDDHLRSDDLFDVATYPTATFTSTRIDVTGTAGRVHGELEIKGVRRPVTLDVEYLGHAEDPWGNYRAVFTASTRINREDWGLTWNMILETGGLVVSKEIRIEIEAELVLQR